MPAQVAAPVETVAADPTVPVRTAMPNQPTRSGGAAVPARTAMPAQVAAPGGAGKAAGGAGKAAARGQVAVPPWPPASEAVEPTDILRPVEVELPVLPAVGRAIVIYQEGSR
jgi:hypothetical protein